MKLPLQFDDNALNELQKGWERYLSSLATNNPPPTDIKIILSKIDAYLHTYIFNPKSDIMFP
jgi:hypothetical protein